MIANSPFGVLSRKTREPRLWSSRDQESLGRDALRNAGLIQAEFHGATAPLSSLINTEQTSALVGSAANSPTLLLRSRDAEPVDDPEFSGGALDFMKDLIGIITDAPPDWSEEHDHYLYGTPRRNRSADGG